MELTKAQEKMILHAIDEKLRKRYPPWTPMKEGFLTAKQFMTLIGLSGKRLQARVMGRFIAAESHQDTSLIGDYLISCFKEGRARIHICQGRGVTNLEYRVAIDDLKEEYQVKAMIIQLSRYTNLKGRKMLEFISKQTGEKPLSFINSFIMEQFNSLSLDTRLALLARHNKVAFSRCIMEAIQKKAEEM